MKRLPFIILLIGLLAVAAHGSKSRDSQAKADYLFMEAMRAKALDHPDAAYELLVRANELAPGDIGIRAELGTYVVALSRGDSAEMARGIGMLTDAYNDAPEYYRGIKVALLNERIGEMDKAREVWRRLHNQYPTREEVTTRYADHLASSDDTLNAALALAIYDSLETTQGKSIPLTSKIIQVIYAQEADTAAVLDKVRQLLATSPRSVEYNVFAGDIFNTMGRRDSAITFYDRACELDPSSGMAAYSRANYYYSIGDTTGFDREVFHALNLDDLDVDTKLAILKGYISEMYADTVQHPRIRAMFDSLIVLHPHEHDIHNMYASYLLVLRDWKAAAEQTELTLDLEPDDEPSWEMLASLYIQADDYGKSAKALKRGLRYFPDEPQLHLMLGSIYSQQDSLTQALTHLQRAASLVSPSDFETRSSVYASMGDVYQKLESMADSVTANYDLAIQLNPENLTALNNYAYYLACNRQDLDRAQAMIDRVVAQKPDDPTSLDTQAWVQFMRKAYDQARKTIDRAMELYSGPSAEVFEHAGDIYFMAGEPDKAVDFWQEAYKLLPDNELLRRKVKHKTYFYK